MKEKKLHQNSELKLSDLAAELDISTHNLTEIINRYVLAIALDAGFSSKSTFNAVFKKQTGMTPSQFRDQHNLTN